ncbi:MAG TPA: hypothetical protein VFT91_10995 [Dehalococcoidia bacterium]|nr:hypothetical protein [Dehalococcoidia bacterium]
MHRIRTKVAWGVIAALSVLVVALAGRMPTPASAAPPVCSPARPHAAGDFSETIVSKSVTRAYLLHVPASYNGSDRTPLVWNFHGLGMTNTLQADVTGLNTKADAAGFVTVTPQGLPQPPFNLPGWNNTLTPGGSDDLAFVGDVLDLLESQLCIDVTRVYSTGLSNGGFMSVRLACSLSARIAAIAPVAGVYYPPLFPVTNPSESCPETRPVPLIAFHGTADTYVPFLGGASVLGPIFRAVEAAIIPDWVSHNGCSAGPQDSQAAAGVRLRAYDGCAEGAKVQLYVVEDADGDGPGTEGGGHQWPGSVSDLVVPPPQPSLGANTHQISANDLMWDFFLAHPMPDSDGDGIPDATDADEDYDGDGYWNGDEALKASVTVNPASKPEYCDGADNDGDTVIDETPAGASWDIDGDTVKDCLDASVDTDGDGLVNTVDADDDGDGRTDVQERKLSADELAACPSGASHDAWPPDRDRDRDADIGDVIQNFGMGKINTPASYDARSDADGDGDDDIGDVIQLYGMGRMNTRCATFTFTNGTGGAVDDIHIVWSQPIGEVYVARDSALAGWSNRTISGGGMVLDMDRPDSSGDLSAGGTLTVVLRTASPMLPAASVCRWTLEGVDVGAC